MHHPRLSLAALALGIFFARSAPAQPRPQLVVQLVPAARPAQVAARARGATSLESTGLLPLRWLAEGLPVPVSARDGETRNPFDLDPERVWLFEARDSAAAEAAARALADDPDVEWVERNQPREPAVTAPASPAAPTGLDPTFPNDPLFRDSRQWALANRGPSGVYGGAAGADIHALEAWALSTGSNDLRLAVADTGVDPDHPDLQAAVPDGGLRIVLGLNVTADPSSGAWADTYGHGTPVAGVMAARTGEGAHFDSLGIAGVCGGDGLLNAGCRIVPIRITAGTASGASSFDIARAALYAAAVGARAMNLSYAGSGPSRLEREALYHALTHGCVVVAAAGNRGAIGRGDAPQYPAAYAADGLCIQVGASDSFDRRAAFSSFGPGLDLVAPGVDIWTTSMLHPSPYGALYDGYLAASGTSFAAPLVTGSVGLLAAARPELLDTDFQHLVRESAGDIGQPGVDRETGWGRLDAAAALRSVTPEMGIWHDEAAAESLAPTTLDSLSVGEAGPGTMDRVRSWPRARRIEASAIVALPDSFLGPVRVWPRVGGTMTVRGEFRLPYFAPWAEVARADSGSFTLRGYLYRSEDCVECPEDDFLPLPPDQARFGFTVIGRVDRPPSLALAAPDTAYRAAPGDTLRLAWRAEDPDQVSAMEVWIEGRVASVRLARLPGNETSVALVVPCPAPFEGPGLLRVIALDEHGHRDASSRTRPIELGARPCPGARMTATRLVTTPNPFRDAIWISAPHTRFITILDVCGRIVRRTLSDDSVRGFQWDGRDDAGRGLGPGLYLVRAEGVGGSVNRKVLKIE